MRLNPLNHPVLPDVFPAAHPIDQPADRSSAALDVPLPPDLCERIRICSARAHVPPKVVFAAAALLYLYHVCDTPPLLLLSCEAGRALSGEWDLLRLPEGCLTENFSALCRNLNTRTAVLSREEESSLPEGGYALSFGSPSAELPAPAALRRLLLIQVTQLPGERYRLHLLYRPAFFAGDGIRLFVRQLFRLLGEAHDWAGTPVGELSPWPKEDELRALGGFSERIGVFQSTAEQFLHTAEAFPERTALWFHGKRMTLQMLNSLSAHAASGLLDLGLGAGETVALLLPPSPVLIACMLGAMRAGCAFLPLNPLDPEERSSYLLTDGRVRLCVVDSPHDLPDGCEAVSAQELLCAPVGSTDRPVSPELPGCVLYRMGASGRPESVRLPFRALARLSSAACSSWHRALRERGRAAISLAPVSDGGFLFEALPALAAGIPLLLAGAGEANSPPLLASRMKEAGVNVLHLPPRRLEAWLRDPALAGAIGQIDLLCIGEDRIDTALFDSVTRAGTDVWRSYGSEETGICSICSPVQAGSAVGVPAADAPFYILSERGELLAPGAMGEIAVGGSGLCLEYGAPAASFSWLRGERVYRTGDYGYLNPSGTLVLTGRRDRRIRLDGRRIEPAEVENQIASSGDIGQCAVLLRQVDGRNTFCAFYTARQDCSPDVVRSRMARFLPAHAVPETIVCLPGMPLCQNGGVDYAVLSGMELPSSETEEAADRPAAAHGADDVSLYDYRGIRKLLSQNRLPASGGRSELGVILLTGATGYLGAHVLYELALKYSGTVYCLVRPKDGMDAEKRLKSRLFYYFETSLQSLFGSRILVVEGDLTQPGLGLSQPLPPVDTVINCAALVGDAPEASHLAVNVEGTRRLISLCQERGARLIQISTLEVAGFIPQRKKREGILLSERGLYVGQRLNRFYLKSKLLAERAVLEAAVSGLDAKVLRLGMLQGRITDGEFQMNMASSRFTQLLRSCVLTGVCPKEFAGMQIRFAPVDLAATALLMLARTPRHYSVFHIVNENSLPVSRLLDSLARLEYPVRTLPDADFAEEIVRLSQTEDGRDAAQGFFLGLTGEKGLDETPCVSDFSLECLHHFGFEWPQLTDTYLDRLMTGLDTFGLFF